MRKIDLYLLLKNRHQKRLSADGLQRTAKPLGVGLTAILSIALAAAALSAGILYARIAANLPTLDVLPVLLDTENGELLQPTRFMDRSAQIVLYTYENPGIQRQNLRVDPDQPAHFSPQLLRTVINALDPTFWESPGYDSADWQNPAPQTIAERLVDDLLLWNEPPSPYRPIRMRLLAGQLVKRFGRTQVLEWYLNSANFGHMAFGAESAAQLYLAKSAQDLTLAEAALLTTLLQYPALNPLDAGDAAIPMQREFLDELYTRQLIQEEEYQTAIDKKFDFKDREKTSPSTPAYIKQIEKQLETSISSSVLYRGGLDVVTTLDADLQGQFQCAATSQLLGLQNSNGSGVAPDETDCPAALLLPTQIFSESAVSSVAAAGIIMDPVSGEVLAYLDPVSASGIKQPDSAYQPGSLLTPFVGLSSFARGYSPASLVWDVPNTLPSASSGQSSASLVYHGAVNLRSALANDYLSPLGALLLREGSLNTSKLASALGMTSAQTSPITPASLFSGSETTLLNLGAAYSTLANSGVRSGAKNAASGEIQPNLIKRVSSTSGRLIIDHEEPQSSAILSEPLAYLINNVLSDESARWPSMGFPNPLEIGIPAAAKTGTTADHSQVWTVGYTPQRLVLVWLGSVDAARPDTGLDTKMAAGIWHAMMKYATQDLPALSWSMPLGVSQVRVCSPSGMLPSADCPLEMQDVFLTGNEPTLPDTLFSKIKINSETGQRATVFTPPELVEEKIFMDVPAEARDWAIQSGLPVAPLGYDSIQQYQPDPSAMLTSPVIFSSVSGKVVVSGTANVEDLASYTVQVGEGINPVSWLQIGETGTRPVIDDKLLTWDTKGLNGLYAIRLSVVDENQRVSTAIIQVTVDNTPPSARITYPSGGQSIQPGAEGVTLTADVQDLVGVARVEWWLDGKLYTTQTNLPFVTLFQSKTGKHKVQLKAWDLAGNQTTTDIIEFTIEK